MATQASDAKCFGPFALAEAQRPLWRTAWDVLCCWLTAISQRADGFGSTAGSQGRLDGGCWHYPRCINVLQAAEALASRRMALFHSDSGEVRACRVGDG